MPSFMQHRALAPVLPAGGVVRTPTLQLIEDAFDRALNGRRVIEPVAIIGAHGVGKTTGLAGIAAKRDNVAFVTAMPSNGRLRAFLSVLVDAFDIATDAKFTSELASVLEYHIPWRVDQGWSLIVDEVQLLDAGAVFQVCKYAELFGLPVVLAGNSHALKRTSANASALEQIRSRISHWLVIDGVSEADIREFGVNANCEGKDAYELLTRYGVKTSLREVVRLLAEAREFAGKSGPIRREAIAEALTSLLGPKQAAAFLTERPT